MAEAMIQRSWPDGETLTVSVEVEESFPDAVAECEASARRLYAEALGITLTTGLDDTADEDVV
jgi:hypothetical protein